MVNQLPNMRGIHPCGSHVDTRKSTGNKNLNRSRGATKYFHTYLWECCHHQFQDFEASFFPVEYYFAHLLFVPEVFKVNFDWEWSVRCTVLQNIFISIVGFVVIVDFKTLKPFPLQLSILAHVSCSFVPGLYRCVFIKDQVKTRDNKLDHLSYNDRRHFELRW